MIDDIEIGNRISLLIEDYSYNFHKGQEGTIVDIYSTSNMSEDYIYRIKIDDFPYALNFNRDEFELIT